MQAKQHIGYVVTNLGTIMVQTPADSRWGFELSDGDRSYTDTATTEGVTSWDAITDDDPRITDEDRERLQWIIDDARDEARN